jgi:serine/threonine-protein kinase
MSPEQALGHAVDARTDLFSLGSVAYLLMAGKPPFEAPSVPGILARVAYQHARPLSELGRDIPPDAEYVVARAMAKSPEDRYADGHMMADDIADVLAGLPPRHRQGWVPPEVGDGTIIAGAALKPAAAPASAKRRRRWPFRLSLVVLLGTATGVYFLDQPGDARFWRRIVEAVKRAAVVAEPEAGSVEAPARNSAPSGGAEAQPASEPEPDGLAPSAQEPALRPVRAETGTAARRGEDAPAASDSAAGVPAAAAEPTPAPEPGPTGELAIDFEHHLREGNLQVWVDGAPVFDSDFDAQETKKILAFTVRKGFLQEVVPLAPGDHEVKVQVKWDDNVRTASIAGTFEPGATRRLDVGVGRIGGKLSLRWK